MDPEKYGGVEFIGEEAGTMSLRDLEEMGIHKDLTKDGIEVLPHEGMGMKDHPLEHFQSLREQGIL